MKVKGVEIQALIVVTCIVRMKLSPFKAMQIMQEAECFLPKEIAYRLADRLIQRERKAGHIHHIKPFPTWEWIGK